MEIEGKSVLITGAARRLGKAMACCLASEGMNVAVHWNTSEEQANQTVLECRSHGVDAVAIHGDLADPGCAPAIVEEARQLGPLHLLVNNASRFEPISFENLNAAELEKDHRIHVLSPTLLSREFARQLPADQSGRIVQMLDWRASTADPTYFTYGLAKAGLLHLTRLLALELAPQITVNAISPGSILPAVNSEGFTDEHQDIDPVLNKSGSVDQILTTLLFLIRQADHTTGHVFPVDGGRTIS